MVISEGHNIVHAYLIRYASLLLHKALETGEELEMAEARIVSLERSFEVGLRLGFESIGFLFDVLKFL